MLKVSVNLLAVASLQQQQYSTAAEQIYSTKTKYINIAIFNNMLELFKELSWLKYQYIYI